ncbi:MAG TPA: PAS domain S-box protein, partial [Phenylobacterium sp.]|nr:PAS domain S-box protein [Phenylobacterium sp.]
MAGGKLAEDTARSRSEALKNAILEASLDCIVTSSAESRVVEWNPAAERTFGFSREEAVGQDLCDLIIPSEQHQAHRAGMARFLATGMGEVIGRRVEVEAIRRNGERFPVELAISTLSLDGQPHFTAYIRDISERVAAAAFLSESRQRLEATYEHAFVGIGEVDAEGRFLRVNQQLSVISGFTREELLQRTLWDITHPDDAVSERELFAEQVAGRLPSYTLEKRYVRKDGAEIWVELSATVVTDAAGKLLYGVRVVRDVTARRKWLEQQRLLINELNHRVKNTLATVQALASQTARSATDPAAAYSLFVDRLTALADAHNI